MPWSHNHTIVSVGLPSSIIVGSCLGGLGSAIRISVDLGMFMAVIKEIELRMERD